MLFVVHSDSLDVRVIRAGKGEETTKSTKDTKKSKNETFDAVFQERCVEVDKQTGSNPGELHVGQPLRRVDSDQLLDALHSMRGADS